LFYVQGGAKPLRQEGSRETFYSNGFSSCCGVLWQGVGCDAIGCHTRTQSRSVCREPGGMCTDWAAAPQGYAQASYAGVASVQQLLHAQLCASAYFSIAYAGMSAVRYPQFNSTASLLQLVSFFCFMRVFLLFLLLIWCVAAGKYRCVLHSTTMDMLIE
jgi:hypothetical protein